MKVLFASAEVFPFASTGGLGDVCRGLPLALRQLGVEVEIAMPLYREVWEKGARPTPFLDLKGNWAEGNSVSVCRGDLEGLTVYFVRHDPFFDRPYIYGPPGRGYPDNAERFALFCRCLLTLGEVLQWPWDVIHCHDWHVALLPLLLKGCPRRPGVLLTIHNLGYQGDFPMEVLERLKVPKGGAEALLHRGRVNFLKGGIVTADLLNTVSPTYAREIQTPDFGFGLEEVLRSRSSDLFGILNGVDYSVWDPRKDPFIAAHYSAEDLSGKALCKADLLKELVLPRGLLERPLFGMVSRLVKQKGLDLLLPLIPKLIRRAGLVILGRGEGRYEEALLDLARRFEVVKVVIAFDEALAHRIEAGSDLYLMPSLYEPCGLNQMYSLRYGTLPVVRDTGGLADTVEEADLEAGRGTGFKFRPFRPASLWKAILKGLRAYSRPGLWSRLQKQAMTRDFSWSRSARQYLQLYRRLRRRR